MHLRVSVPNVFTLNTLRMMFVAHSEKKKHQTDSDSWLWGGDAMKNGWVRVRKESFEFAVVQAGQAN